MFIHNSEMRIDCFSHTGCEEWGAEDWRPSLEGTQMLKCVIFYTLFLRESFWSDTFIFCYKGYFLCYSSHCIFITQKESLFLIIHCFVFHISKFKVIFCSYCLFTYKPFIHFHYLFLLHDSLLLMSCLWQSSRFLGWRSHWVVIEDGTLSWYHRQWVTFYLNIYIVCIYIYVVFVR